MSEKRMWAAFEDYLNGPATKRRNETGWTFDERFKAWADSEAVTLVTPNNTLQVATSKDMEAAFLGGISSRETDVQTAELAEAIGLLEDAMRQACHPLADDLDPVPGQPDAEWFDTGALGTWRDIGDYLVEHAGWIRHPSGAGRRQFYRPPGKGGERDV